MAEELGLGVLPWSPLKMGKLSGKYTRQNKEQLQGVRGAIVGQLSEKDYDIIDELQKVASEHETDVATIALAWVQTKQGISSTINGARTIQTIRTPIPGLSNPTFPWSRLLHIT